MNRTCIFILSFVAGFFIIVGMWHRALRSEEQTPIVGPIYPRACTMEARVCPDGSAVGRSGPNCEFAPCPPVAQNSSEPTDPSAVADGEFPTPTPFTGKFTRQLSDRNDVIVSTGAFTCVIGGDPTSPHGATTQKTINKTPYCINTSVEGAAGTTFSTYTYTTALGSDRLISLKFVIAASNCGNYDKPEMLECAREQKLLNPDVLAKDMLRTLP